MLRKTVRGRVITPDRLRQREHSSGIYAIILMITRGTSSLKAV